MRTTIDIPDELYREAKIRAAREGIRLKDLIGQMLEAGLRKPPTDELRTERRRSPLPVVRPATGHTLPARTGAELNRILEEEDIPRDMRHAG